MINKDGFLKKTKEDKKNTLKKQQLLKDVWEQCTFDEIIDAGFDYNKDNDKSRKQIFIDRLISLFEKTGNNYLPSARNVMKILYKYYETDELLDYFNIDDMIDHCDGSWEMDDYIKDECDRAVEEYKYEMSEMYVPYTKNDFQNEVEEMNKYDFKRFLCDVTRNSYFCDDEKLLNDLKNKI